MRFFGLWPQNDGKIMFKLSSQPLQIQSYLKELRNPAAGAFASFEGWVRNIHEGKAVSSLEYEALPPMCETEAEKILAEAIEKFGVLKAMCLHRTGRVSVGEMAVWVGVTAGHRDEAFKACRYIIDEIKKRLPIWKKEFYTDGSSSWVNCQHGHKELTAQDYYSRQEILPEIGKDGQNKLKDAKVLVVGAGGLGSVALISLAQAGVGTIGICEFDRLEASNLHRQPLYSTHDIGKPKIDLAEKFLHSLNPFVVIYKHPTRLAVENYKEIISNYDFILDCSDNFKTKFLLNDIAVIEKKVLIQASIYQFEGQVRVYDPKTNSSCLRCSWQQIPSDNCVGTCTEAGVLGFVPAIVGNLQANEAIKKILSLPSLAGGETLFIDLKTYTLGRMTQNKNPQCPVCGSSLSIKTIENKNYMSVSQTDFSVNIENVSSLDEYTLVDVRSTDERRADPVENFNTTHHPATELGQWRNSIVPDNKYLFFCIKGIRSAKCVEHLRASGLKNIWSIQGGVAAVQNYLTSLPKG